MYFRCKMLTAKKGESVNVYCAELVAETYKRMGLLPLDEPFNCLTPKDFSSEGQLLFLRWAKLGKEIFFRVRIEDLSVTQDSE